MHWRTDVAEVAGIYDDLDVGVLSGDPLQDGDGRVRRCVVDEDVLVAIAAYRSHDVADLAVKLLDVVLLVIAGGDDADGFHTEVSLTVWQGNVCEDWLPGVDLRVTSKCDSDRVRS